MLDGPFTGRGEDPRARTEARDDEIEAGVGLRAGSIDER